MSHLKPTVCALVATLLAAACSSGGQSSLPSGPNWSLTEQRQGLGHTGTTGVVVDGANPGPNSLYEYRGGRDPVTGQARAVEGAPAANQPSQPHKAAPRAVGTQGSQGTVVEVRKGDTLHGLSLQHHVSVNALMTANKLASATIIPGQKLVIPPRL